MVDGSGSTLKRRSTPASERTPSPPKQPVAQAKQTQSLLSWLMAHNPISPRSGNYERLEGGMGPTRMGLGRRFAWKKFAIGATVIIGLVWFFGPREGHLKNIGSVPGKGKTTITTTAPTVTTTNKDALEYIPPVHEDDIKTPAHPKPTSYASDPDPSKTVFCTVPYKPTLPLVQYALMIDAGSTGSRIHVYKFNNCGPSPAYEYEVFEQTHPGLSKFKDKPLEAAQSLDVLLEVAMKTVPVSLRKCTPVAVKATAGLRLLGPAHSAAILEAVEDRIATKYPFMLPEKDGVVVMDGKDEGVFAWITANYLLSAIGSSTPGSPHSASYAVLDLGGSSTQIVFEPIFSKPDSSLVEGEHKYDLSFGGKNYVLYQHSYLGYGLMRARQSVHRLVEFMASIRTDKKENKDSVISNPCLAIGTTRDVVIEDEASGTKRSITMGGADVGSYEACNRVMELVMAKDAICEVKPCSFNGVYQPSLMDTFASGKVLLLSYFYDRLYPLISHTNPPKLTVSTLGQMAQIICQGKTEWTKHWGSDRELMDELEGRPEWCLDLTFMHALLRLGYEFEDSRQVAIGKQIDGTELGWALGATITMVGGSLKCRA